MFSIRYYPAIKKEDQLPKIIHGLENIKQLFSQLQHPKVNFQQAFMSYSLIKKPIVSTSRHKTIISLYCYGLIEDSLEPTFGMQVKG